jgi:hypothetical protein
MRGSVPHDYGHVSYHPTLESPKKPLLLTDRYHARPVQSDVVALVIARIESRQPMDLGTISRQLCRVSFYPVASQAIP